MKSLHRILCAGLLLLLCFLLTCCGKKTEDPSDDPIDSAAQTDSRTEESVPCDAPDPLDALLRCVQVTEEASSFSSALEGSCSTQVLLLSYTQQVRSERTVTADAMFSQSVSVSSLVRVGVQQYFQGDTVLVRNGDVRALDDVNWAKEATSVTPEAYRAAYGNTPRSLSNYLINAETVLFAQLESASETEITVVCELDPVASTAEYAKQVKTNGGLDELPVFSSVTLTVTMDGSYRPIRVRYQEIYNISIAILGSTTCKTDYTETFSDFNAVTSVPEREFFEPFLSSPVAAYPEISSGYSLLSSLLGNSSSYDVTLEAAEQMFSAQLSLDTVSGAILLHGETVDFLYNDDRYYLLSAENRVFADAEELNQLLRPLTEQALLPGSQEQGGGASSLFSDMHMQTENGTLLLQAGNEKDFFHASIDLRSLSIRSVELCLSGSGEPFRLLIKKTEDASPFPSLENCTDLTPSLFAFSFLEELPALREGKTLSARLRAEGGSAYAADLTLSLQDGVCFSVLSTSDALPLSVYGKGEAITAVWEDVALTGKYEDFTALLALFSATQKQAATTTDIPRPHLVAEPGKLTLRFGSGFSLTFAGSEIRLSGDDLSARLSILGTSSRKVSTAPKTAHRLAVADLASFLSDSVYPTLLRADAMTGKVTLTRGGEDTHFRLRARLNDSLALGLTTVWSGAKTDLLYTDGTLFLSHPAVNAFLPLEELPALADSFQTLSGGASFDGARSFAITSVSCNGKELILDLGEITITLKKDRFIVSGAEWEAIGTALAPTDKQDSFATPDRSTCVDLASLAKRIAPLAEQKNFAFTGRYEGENFSATFSRLSFSLNKSGGLDDVAVDLLPDGASDPIRLFYDGGCLFLDIGETRLFCLADALFPDGILQTSSGDAMSAADLLSNVKKVTFRNDILEVETADARLHVKWNGNALSSVSYSSAARTLSLQRASFAPVQTPPLEQYTDVTPLAGLLQAAAATAESGSVAFDGKIDLRAFSLSLTDIRVSGAFRFSGTDIEGAVTIVLPYLPGLTSDGVPLLQGNRLLTDCTMCSELFLTDGKLYMRRTAEAAYGILRPQSYTLTETVYLTSEEALADPLRALAFLLRLDPNVIAGGGSGSGDSSGNAGTGGLLKRASCAGNRYTLALNPSVVLPVADSILLTAQTDGTYVTDVGAEINFPHLSVVASGALLAHGGVDLSPVLQQDFSGYVHLHN